MKFSEIKNGKFTKNGRTHIKIVKPLSLDNIPQNAVDDEGYLLALDDNDDVSIPRLYKEIKPGETFYYDNAKYIKLDNGYVYNNKYYADNFVAGTLVEIR